MIYSRLIRPLLFRLDPEEAHQRVMKLLRLVDASQWPRRLMTKMFQVDDPALGVQVGRLTFSNPVGLAAGFDKYMGAPLAYPAFGFGFAELGSITFEEQDGNPKPRLWRLPKDKSLIVYYGLANCGAKKAREKLSNYNQHPIPFGASIAPSTAVDASQMADDYLRSFSELHSFADYVTLNVSCPNVARCDVFTQVSFIQELIGKVTSYCRANGIDKDIFVKVGPDMSLDNLDKVVDACLAQGITGVIASNLVKDRASLACKSTAEEMAHPGGVSGKLVWDKSNAVIRHVFKRAGDRLKIIGVGGVFTAEDAYEKIKCGASAVQLITGWIYGGPFAIRAINLGLLKLLDRDGFKNIREVVGRKDNVNPI